MHKLLLRLIVSLFRSGCQQWRRQRRRKIVGGNILLRGADELEQWHKRLLKVTPVTSRKEFDEPPLKHAHTQTVFEASTSLFAIEKC